MYHALCMHVSLMCMQYACDMLYVGLISRRLHRGRHKPVLH